MSSQGFAQFIPLILIFIIFYFFLIRPQQKRVKDHKQMVENLKRGDEIITSGGIIGTIDKIMEDDRIEVIISDNVKVQIIRSTIPIIPPDVITSSPLFRDSTIAL